MEERRMRVEDNPIAFMSETLRALTFREHPYRQPTIGWAKDIAGWKLEDLKAHYDLYYRPRNAFIVVVGDFDSKALGDKIAQAFGAAGRTEPPPVRAREGEPRGRDASSSSVQHFAFVAIEYVAPNLHGPDSAAIAVLEHPLRAAERAPVPRPGPGPAHRARREREL
jgi:predicted Zn-dependent peptidase